MTLEAGNVVAAGLPIPSQARAVPGTDVNLKMNSGHPELY
jgi:hypothetical protein